MQPIRMMGPAHGYDEIIRRLNKIDREILEDIEMTLAGARDPVFLWTEESLKIERDVYNEIKQKIDDLRSDLEIAISNFVRFP